MAGLRAGLRPEPILTVSAWADEHRYLSPIASAEAGKYKTSRTPYLKKPMDCLSAKAPYRRVVFMKSAQVGATEMGNNWLGYIMSSAPAPTLVVMPTDGMIKRNTKTRIDPMINSSPILSEKVRKQKSRDSGNTNKSKEGPGFIIYFAGANSSSELSSMPARNVMFDEVDRYPVDLDGEGSPIELGRARSTTFSKRKEFMASTPTTEGVSVIAKEFDKTDQNWYHVPCPCCGVYQKLMFPQLKWDIGVDGKACNVRYKCIECDEEFEERHKTSMLENGEWIPDCPQNISLDVIGFFINALYSPLGWFSWKDIAQKFMDAKDDPILLKAFVNLILGETWKEKGERPEWESLYNKRELYKTNCPPKDVCVITVGADVQKDRIELEILGFCKGRRTYSIDYRILHGNVEEQDVWNKLAMVVNETWEREDGIQLPMTRMALDTGAYTSIAYAFCRRFDVTKVTPVKGGPDSQAVMVAAPRKVDVSKSGKKIGKLKVWMVGGSIYKMETYAWLKLNKQDGEPIPPGYCHFPEYGPEYFKGLTAEQQEIKLVRGYRKYEWVKKYDRNEPLDCRVYARAAATMIGIDMWKDAQYDKIVGMAPVKKKREPRKLDDDYWV